MNISDKQMKRLQRIGQKYDLKLLLLHGSYATGKQHPGSDLDIAYLPQKSLDFDYQLSLHSEIADVFGDGPERDLDLKSLGKADPLFRHEVARDSQLLWGDRLVYDEFCADAFARYQDAHRLFELEHLLSRRLLASLISRHG